MEVVIVIGLDTGCFVFGKVWFNCKDIYQKRDFLVPNSRWNSQEAPESNAVERRFGGGWSFPAQRSWPQRLIEILYQNGLMFEFDTWICESYWEGSDLKHRYTGKDMGHKRLPTSMSCEEAVDPMRLLEENLTDEEETRKKVLPACQVLQLYGILFSLEPKNCRLQSCRCFTIMARWWNVWIQ